MITSPLFSVIIPTYNRGYCLWRAIQSVLSQDYPFFELLIVDDGSIDNTKLVAKQFQKDPRVLFISAKHGGGSYARNVGLQKAKGTLVTYLDSDDCFYPSFLSVMRAFFEKNKQAVFGISNYNRWLELYDADGNLLTTTRYSSQQKETIVLQDYYHWNIRTTGTGLMHKKDVLKKGIKWDEKFFYLEDLDFVMQLGNYFPKGFLHVPVVLHEYVQRYGNDSMCSNASYKDWGRAFEKIYQKHKTDTLMKGQQWYPEKIEKYKKLQKEFEEGRGVPAMYKNFPEYYKRDKGKG